MLTLVKAARRFSALVAATPTIGARFQALNPRTIVVNNYPSGGYSRW